MVRSYKRKTEAVSSQSLLSAAALVKQKSSSVRQAAKAHGIDRMTLTRYISRGKLGEKVLSQTHMVFTQKQEEALAEHVRALDHQFYGLSVEQVQRLAYEYSVANQINAMPTSWQRDKKAGKEWLSSFMRRNKLSVRSPEATSLARQSGFNRVSVGRFFEHLRSAMDRYKFSPADIYNIDETGVSTVQKPRKVVSITGKKQVGAVSSYERGELTTLCCAINAAGSHIPPFYIFPRVNMKASFMNGAPPGSKGCAAQSGYMNSDLFVNEYLPFFIDNTRCSLEKPVLLILDNHNSHISYAAVELCKSSGVVLLTLPPHCSHRLQPLDRAVYGPLKAYYNTAIDDWMRSNPARTVTIYEVGQLAGVAYNKCTTTNNILSAFSCTGIYPLNPDVFGDYEFLPSATTDRPQTDEAGDTERQANNVRTPRMAANHQVLATDSGGSKSANASYISPEQILPLPAAAPRKSAVTRRKVASAILTDTPEKERIRQESEEKNAKRLKKGVSTSEVAVTKKRRTSKKKSKKVDDSSDDDEPLATALLCSDEDSPDEDDESHDHMHSVLPAEGNINVNSHVLVQYETKKTTIFYAGKIVKLPKDGYYTVMFMRQVSKSCSPCAFIYPEEDDIQDVPLSSIMLLLGDPVSCVGTARVRQRQTFRVDLSPFIAGLH